ncbi:uncharacterized protein LOC135076716 [Ostrinia nubilalis]|uniref:uncharacterized protein LOC135076716 n=1 Tax=Ostrinia nubilalis TaxID=29057 RepID=UPI00308251DD
MLCSSKGCIVIFLSIIISRVLSESDDDEDITPTYVEDNSMEKGERNPEYFTTGEAVPEASEDQNPGPDTDDGDAKLPSLLDLKMDYRMLKAKCPYFKHGDDLDLNQIADVWQVAYFQLQEDISCFKIHIKKTTDEDKKAYSDRYGSFSDKVNWSACDLEIRASDKSETQRRHFLQRREKGIMENVIILEQIGRNDTTYSLHTESPDQWLVVKHLLLMRDCSDGELVVFSRVPHQPRRKDVMDALVMFGEYTMEGKMACE